MIAGTVGIGETDKIEHVLDFTDYARPLTADIVHADLAEANNTWFHGNGGVSKIVLWSHQWLWLAHEAGLVTGPVELQRSATKHHHQYLIQQYGAVGKNSLWGVEVEVRK